METKTIKTIDVNAKEWFDKVNGNSYFSANVCINFGMEDQENITMPFQYGYGDHYIDMAMDKLIEDNYIGDFKENGINLPLWRFCEDNDIILRTNKQENCLKRQL